MNQLATKNLGNRNFFWAWFVGVNLALVAATLWVGKIALFAPIVGIGGSFLSLYFAKFLAIRAHGIQLIDPANPRSGAEKQLYDIVADLARKAGLEHVPAVGVYKSPDMNAFATGASQKAALVAFTDQLLEVLSPDEIRAVAAHEIAHIANRDMLAMVLLQGVVNSVVIAVVAPLNLARIVNLFSKDFSWLFELLFWAFKIVVALVLTFLGGLIVKAYSRRRELRADAMAARLCGSAPMIAALRKIDHDTAIIPKAQLGYAALKISGRSSIGEWLSTHPTTARRIAMLEQLPSTPSIGDIA